MSKPKIHKTVLLHAAEATVKKAVATKDRERIKRALSRWGEDRDTVIDAIAAGNYTTDNKHVVVRIESDQDETETKRPT